MGWGPVNLLPLYNVKHCAKVSSRRGWKGSWAGPSQELGVAWGQVTLLTAAIMSTYYGTGTVQSASHEFFSSSPLAYKRKLKFGEGSSCWVSSPAVADGVGSPGQRFW